MALAVKLWGSGWAEVELQQTVKGGTCADVDLLIITVAGSSLAGISYKAGGCQAARGEAPEFGSIWHR